MDLSPLIISIKISIISTIFTIILGVLAAYTVSRLKKFHTIIDIIFTLPIILPPTVVGFFLLVGLGKNSFIGQFLNKFDINLVFSLTGAIIASIVVSLPLMYRTVRGAFAQVDSDIIYAARTLGISEFDIFKKILIPTCYPGIIAGAVLSFARALGEFGATMMFSGNIPGKTQTISIKIYTEVQAGNYDIAYQWVGIIMIMSLISISSLNYFEHKQAVVIKGKRSLW